MTTCEFCGLSEISEYFLPNAKTGSFEMVSVCRNCGPIAGGPVELLTRQRPTRQSIHARNAIDWAQRSVCRRKRVGCVITNLDMNSVMSTGYNGPGHNIAHDRKCTGFNQPGECGCVHAEINASLFIGPNLKPKAAFTTSTPCEICAQVFLRINVLQLYFIEPYRDRTGLEIFLSAPGRDAFRITGLNPFNTLKVT